MGRRPLNTTKSGKFMNPTDQARKEWRKKELKRNKRQRTAVRHAVLKNKDPAKLIKELEDIDEIEYDVTQPPRLNEKVLKEKRKKLLETFDRVLQLYEKEEPEFSLDMKRMMVVYEKQRQKKETHYLQVKSAERVRLEQIPLPQMPAEAVPMPGEIPMPMDFPDATPLHGILKRGKSSIPGPPPGRPPGIEKKPEGPPPGPPPPLSDSESELEADDLYDPEKAGDGDGVDGESSNKRRRRGVRFADSQETNVSSLQKKMLRMAGQGHESSDSESSEDESQMRRRTPSGSDSDEEQKEAASSGPPQALPDPSDVPLPPSVPAGAPPMFRPPPMRVPPPGLMPPGPPPGRPPGLPPGPPPGVPRTIRPLPPAMTRGVPPRGLRPGLSASVQPAAYGAAARVRAPAELAVNPNVLSAPPSISRPPQRQGGGSEQISEATIQSKPRLNQGFGDVKRFLPTALKVRREYKDSKGRLIKAQGKEEVPLGPSLPPAASAAPAGDSQPKPKAKDDEYEQFMQEMNTLL